MVDGSMGSVMAIIMLCFMWSMYKGKATKIAVLAGTVEILFVILGPPAGGRNWNARTQRVWPKLGAKWPTTFASGKVGFRCDGAQRYEEACSGPTDLKWLGPLISY